MSFITHKLAGYRGTKNNGQKHEILREIYVTTLHYNVCLIKGSDDIESAFCDTIYTIKPSVHKQLIRYHQNTFLGTHCNPLLGKTRIFFFCERTT